MYKVNLAMALLNLLNSLNKAYLIRKKLKIRSKVGIVLLLIYELRNKSIKHLNFIITLL